MLSLQVRWLGSPEGHLSAQWFWEVAVDLPHDVSRPFLSVGWIGLMLYSVWISNFDSWFGAGATGVFSSASQVGFMQVFL